MGKRQKFYDTWSKEQRIDAAKGRTKKVVDHLLYLIQIHANNSFVVYSKVLASQIPTSYAAHAFQAFHQHHQFEIVRLCSLWDGVGEHRESIPTVVGLIDDEEIVETLANEMASHWGGGHMSIINPSPDPAMAELERQAAIQNDKLFGIQEGQRVRAGLAAARADVYAIQKWPPLIALMNMRHKHLAHNLTTTTRETHEPVKPLQYGDETLVLTKTIPLVETLYRCVNGASFAFDASQQFHQENAEALWKGCKFVDLQ